MPPYLEPVATLSVEIDQPYVVGEIGSKTLMYASDYPHWDMSWPESGSILWNREDLSLDAKKDLLLNNAKRFYNLS